MSVRLAQSCRNVCLAALVAASAWATDGGGEFEGIYRVGHTTCSVTPVKMAFEVRWAKGSGAMVFFYEWRSPFGEHVYVSEAKPNGVDRFVFATAELTAGVLLRADGARLPVTKVRSEQFDRGESP